MKNVSNNVFATLVVFVLFICPCFTTSTFADEDDQWWNGDWPYRVPVTVSGSGVGQVSIDFSDAFSQLGLNGALLDLRSIRVVSYNGMVPGTSVPYEESYSVMLDDADNPTINYSATEDCYWTANDGSLESDTSRFSQGTGSLKATIENNAGGYGYPGIEFRINAGGITDWRNYEVFIYDVWPQVNASALDQSPDLYDFKLYNTNGCSSANITQGGPPLSLDTWNYVSVSLNPCYTCTTPDFDDITRMEFHTRDNETVSGNSGLWDDGDRLTMWLDNLQLVDQNGGGAIKWNVDGSTTKYYIYFDVLEHEGHPQPELTTLGAATLTGSSGTPEAGGYLHKITGASAQGLAVWTAPVVEKIFKTNQTPVSTTALRIYGAGNEFEPFQLVVRSETTQNLAVNISDFACGDETIPASNVKLHRVDYVTLTQISDHFGRLGDWPDPLYPVSMGGIIPFVADTNQPLWFTVRIPAGTTAGVYTANVSIGSAVVPVELEVWNFNLPSQIHLAGEWGFDWNSVVESYKGTIGGTPQSCYWTLVDALYEDFADHRLTPKGVGWPAGLNYPGGVDYDCAGTLDADAWGDWDFHTLASKYLSGSELENGTGFPSFLITGPSSNVPSGSRPSSFCGESRGTEPPGNAAYNTVWFQYWTAISDYLGDTSDFADKGYYHIVNEPQTFDDYDIVAYLAQKTKQAAPNVRIMVSEQVEPDIYDNSTYSDAKIDIWMPTISNYQLERAHERQLNHDEDVWWYFLYGDRPPLPNPTVMDRTGLDARITPWLAWLERVDGLFYYSTTDWSPNPWTNPWINNGNGDGFMMYPPKDTSIASDSCSNESNRLVPSIRWELLREGMEDYEYLWLLNQGGPQIDVANKADVRANQFILSRTRFSRVPTDLFKTRAAIASDIINGNSLDNGGGSGGGGGGGCFINSLDK
ncbi:MAG: DUF4091 domain-containing protein [Proteobacteria bacterium]|nr:DUF4091 domain-containing protein [Pseudomonadota bacterium]